MTTKSPDSQRENGGTIMNIKVNINNRKWAIQSYKDGQLMEELIVDNLKDAQRIANEFEAKYGEYSTSIKMI